ncbi:type II secretion system minor pseudopilin GspJ [Oceanospirillum maris]|uniref:type II secretion system minor pseudopilin GspJ n=1 Tax=Oceanospirillum maris TaxID=64977 RepID=UPI0004221A64|nr:type II secretion system minor pseudopilin GspJ [Oceanospirillum maris]
MGQKKLIMVQEHSKAQAGFTLLELLIAVAIFAFIGLAGYQLLNSVIGTYEHTRERSTSFSQLQKAVSIIEQDIKHLSRRSIRDELGDPLPAFSAHYRGGLPLEFTRSGGWFMADQGNASTGVKQRIAYRLENDQLQRLIWPVLDRAQDSKPQVQLLLNHVSHFNVRLLGMTEQGTGAGITTESQWQDFWPVENQQGQIDFLALPRGVDISFTLKSYGQVRRIFSREGI